VTWTIVLDSGPLGFVTHPKPEAENLACALWLEKRLDEGCRIIVPAIVDYEVRRELIRAKKNASLRRLDAFCDAHDFLSITDAHLRHAAELWATIRQQGRPTAPDPAIDGDVILAVQVLSLNDPTAVVATTNPTHLSLFVTADLWQNIE
jgi:predicted nucleic acid-binding protein